MKDFYFSMWLRQEMKKQKIGQRELARRSGINHATISRILGGDHKDVLVNTAATISQSLGYDLVILKK